MKKILIISHDKIGHQMAGPGIRYHFMARELAKDFSVTVGFFDKDYIPPLGFPESYTTQYIPRDSFSESFSDFDIIIAMWLSDEMIEYCHNNNKFIVFDMYAPVPVENLALFLYSGNPITPHTDQEYLASCVMYDNFLRNGDLFLVSNQRQLDLWIGYMFGADQARVTSYEWRPFFDRFVYAPMGIDARMSLKKTNKVLRDVIPGIGKDDKVLIWTGGIWNWYDGQVLVHAMARLKTTHPEIKLVFFGTKHPNPNVPEMKETTRTHDLAVQLGLLGENVFMQQTWVPYNDRIDYLLEADVAINTNKPSIESEFSHRTRVLDHILAGLPTISTAGDYLTDQVIVPRGMGYSVPPNDVDALVETIVKSLKPSELKSVKSHIEEFRGDFDWSVTLNQLRIYLLGNPDKLGVLPKNQVTPRSSRTGYKIARKITPTFAKKLLRKVISYGT